MNRPFSLGFLLAAIATGTSAYGAGSSILPTTDPAPARVESTKYWELTDYLRGTPPQVRDKLNGELERLSAKVNQTQRALAEAERECELELKKTEDRAHRSLQYQQLVNEKTQADAALQAARKSGSPEERVEASSRFNRARVALEQFDRDLPSQSPALAEARKKADEIAQDLHRLREGWAKAGAWRNDLLDAIRNGFRLRAPVVENSKGTLPGVTIERINDAQNMLVDYDAIAFGASGKDEEGVRTASAHTVPIKVLVSGIETAGFKQGQQIDLDREFIIERRDSSDSDGLIYAAKPYPSLDIDQLFEVIVPLRVQVVKPATPAGSTVVKK